MAAMRASSAIALLLGIAVVSAVMFAGGTGQAQETGWMVTDFSATYRIEADGTIRVEERIAVDFRGLRKHGIFRDLYESVTCGTPAPDAQLPIHPCPAGAVRAWRYSDFKVVDEQGKRWKFEKESVPGMVRLRIGDPDRTVSGRQVYVVSYRIERGLDAFADHDEFYWNVTGTWNVPIEQFAVRVILPAGAAPVAACYVGEVGSEESCAMEVAGSEVRYTGRRLEYLEQVTVAVGWDRGIVQVAPPLIIEPARPGDYFELDALEWGGFVFTALASTAAAMGLWWRHGRDRQYRTIYYLTRDRTEGPKPLFGAPPLVVEYLPPEDLRPAQMGVLLDERAHTLDVTATIIDLAVRGYLHITEIPKQGWFGRADWELAKRKDGDDLLPYERSLLRALFESGDQVKVSDLKYKFADDLEKTRQLIYDDAMGRGWFAMRPESAKASWSVVALGVFAATVGLVLLSATLAGRGLMPLGAGVGGLVLMGLAPSMARRTARGSELLRRVLGFREYIATAETHRQEFNEQENIFARYLPFAIVFGCVEKWAKAFEGIDDRVRESTAAWYSGGGPFRVMAFSEGLRSFNSSVGSTLASTRSSGGGSGFGGGGSAGGGRGGGGGGSW
jgi:hypothetical protein